MQPRTVHQAIRGVCAIAVALLLCVALLPGLSAEPARGPMPTDAELGQFFTRREAQLQRLVRMSNKDASVWRIAPDFAYADDGRSVTAKAGLPQQRLEEYRGIFRRLGLTTGLTREAVGAAEGIFLPVALRQQGFDSEEKGIAYVPGKPAPLVGSLDVLPIAPKNPQPVFRRLKGDWYLYWRYNK